jgi:CHASE2 domain-containing sensor protein
LLVIKALNASHPISRVIDRPAETRPNVWAWIILWVTGLAMRLLGAFLLPNAEQDGYSYAEIIARWSASFSAGHFRLADVFGFWLPLFPFAAAIPNIWIGNPLLVGKILSGVCGATSCLLIFVITKTLTRNVVLACL